jgi:hypothetical protein
MEQPPKKKGMRKSELQSKARGLGELALQTLSSIMASEGPSPIRLAAAREVLDRGFGRPRIAEADPAKASQGFRVVVRQFTDERDDDPAGDAEDRA